MQTLCAVDLTKIPGTDDLWRPQRPAANPPAEIPLGLPRNGYASPFGFWFATAESWGAVTTSLRVEIFDSGELARQGHGGDSQSQSFAAAHNSRQMRVKLKTRSRQSADLSTALLLEIDPDKARVETGSASWSSVSNTVLFVVAQYWRFSAIDNLLRDLTAWARGDLVSHGLIHLIQSNRLGSFRAHRRALQALVLDLPAFELSLTNPRACFASGGPIRLYRTLAAQLELDRHRRAIDEHVEVVEAVFDALAESRNHSQALAFQIVFELAIVALLLLDVSLYLWDSFLR